MHKQRYNKDQLKQKVVTQIKEEGLDNVFSPEVIENIKERVYHMIKKQEALDELNGDQNDGLQENQTRPPISAGPNHFPYEDDFQQSNIDVDDSVEAEPAGKLPGEDPTDVPYEPVRAVSEPAPVPKPLQDEKPGEVIVFDYNEAAAVSGENLANKPFRLKDDPEKKQTIHDFWMNEGKTKVKVYAAKFEEIGTIDFNYQNGTAHFYDVKQPTTADNTTYHENPYASDAKPEIVNPNTEPDLRKSIESSVDLQDALEKVMKDILRDGLKDSPETTEPTIPTPAPVQERLTVDDIKNDLKKTEIPKKLEMRLLGEMVQDVNYLSQNQEYASYELDDKIYYVLNEDHTKAYTKA